MSTKSTLAHGPNFHLYNEVFDDENVYLSLEKVHFEVDPDHVVISIPIHVWEVIRKFDGADFSLVNKGDEDILAMVERDVDARIKEYSQKPILGISGSLVYGDPEDSRDAQIDAGVAYYIEQREKQRQAKEAVKRLMAQQNQ